MELEELNGENIIWQQVVGLRTEYYFNEVLFVQLDLQSKVSFLAYSHDQTLKVIKRFLYLLFFFQMASKLILGCLALMVVSTYARSSKFESFWFNSKLYRNKVNWVNNITLTRTLDIGSK